MKAVLQNFRTGELTVSDTPPPVLKPGGVLVHNVASLVSIGTEKAVIELSRKSALGKARARPDLVRRVIERARHDGVLATARAVGSLVAAPMPLGYSCAGVVRAVGAGVTDLEPGQLVACAGAGYANHAEVVFVPRNLAVAIPDGVTPQDAAFVTVGAIALHGVRQAEVNVGESVVVLGLGLVGQLIVQICAASGCRVFGIDLDAAKVRLATELGAQRGHCLADGDAAPGLRAFTRGRGADAVLIAAATKSSDPIELAAELARDRARVVAVGDVGLNLPRRAYYEKELELRQSRSYGPGRYDPSYEEKGIDYPPGYVRWTENRNMEAFLDLVGAGKVRIPPLISHRFPIEQAEKAYELLSGASSEPIIGIVLDYDVADTQPAQIRLRSAPAGKPDTATLRFGIIGAGRFAQSVLLPKLKAIPGVTLASFATGKGYTARAVAERYGAENCTSDYHAIVEDAAIDAVVIATRHDLHAEIACAALKAGKHVFVEKPLALNEAELADVAAALEAASAAPHLLVGFNRRFSPLAAELKSALSGSPLAMSYRINAGAVGADSWQQDAEAGGGRIVGEVCHFIDLMQYLAGADAIEVFATAIEADQRLPADPDNLTINIRFANGSAGALVYTSAGDPGFPKERIEAFGGGVAGAIDNWRRLTIRGAGVNTSKRWWLDSAKGHGEELTAFVDGIRSGVPAIAIDSLIATTLATFAIQRSLRTGAPAPVGFAPPEASREAGD